jgi:hypothetical protein
MASSGDTVLMATVTGLVYGITPVNLRTLMGAAPAAHGVTTNYLPYAATSTSWGTSDVRVVNDSVTGVNGVLSITTSIGQYPFVSDYPFFMLSDGQGGEPPWDGDGDLIISSTGALWTSHDIHFVDMSDSQLVFSIVDDGYCQSWLGHRFDYNTASMAAVFDGDKNLISSPTVSSTELSLLDGLTHPIVTGSGTNSYLAYFIGDTLASAPIHFDGDLTFDSNDSADKVIITADGGTDEDECILIYDYASGGNIERVDDGLGGNRGSFRFYNSNAATGSKLEFLGNFGGGDGRTAIYSDTGSDVIVGSVSNVGGWGYLDIVNLHMKIFGATAQQTRFGAFAAGIIDIRCDSGSVRISGEGRDTYGLMVSGTDYTGTSVGQIDADEPFFFNTWYKGVSDTNFQAYCSLYDSDTYRARVNAYFRVRDSSMIITIPEVTGTLSGAAAYIRHPYIKPSLLASVNLPAIIVENGATTSGCLVPAAGSLRIYDDDVSDLASGTGGVKNCEVRFRF